MEPSKVKFKGLAKQLMSLGLLVLVVAAFIAYFGDSISTNTFGALAFMATTISLVLVYFGWIAVRLGLIFAVIAGVLLLGVMFTDVQKQPLVQASKYQAVFFTNGQVYFGHLNNAESKNPTLTDVYFLQSDSSQNPQNSTDTQSSQGQLSVVKLENAIHGPENRMTLKSDQILFWENLKDSSKVLELIKQDRQKR